ncbi:serine hydrolase [Anaerocolumna sp. AGMB13025]|uniref:serine hydrolase domain-containing protein n=1 Tax=Anaerocolumna sp. AGMB13025 TaxID=3039116 RepID=UPI00241ED755|nr:serine hydrolase domain-containing protein [Anaerocolumna sp. AGMB13025]WFR58053.1 serine hydrolase [Anaerocolumna sp. AGMB13025]
MHTNVIKKAASIILMFCIVCLSSLFVSAAEKETGGEFSKIDSFIEKEMKDCRIPGLSLGIVKENKIIYQKGYGVADPTGRSVTPETPFLIASLSKSFTAMAILKLAEEKKLELDKPVQAYIPGFQLADSKAASEITIRELLNHTSGIREKDEYAVENLRDDGVSLEEQIKRMRHIKPGPKVFQYGNLNYNILGKVIENVTGLPYGDYINEIIIKPLDMNHSYVSRDKAKENGLAAGYRSLFGFPVPVELPYRTCNLASAGMISCAADISNYMLALLNKGSYQNRQILSESSIRSLMTPSSNVSNHVSYGFGWYVTSGSVYHGGEFMNYQSKVKLLPEDSIGVVILYNTSSAIYTTLFKSGYRDRIESGIISILYGYEPDTVQPGTKIFDLNHYPMGVTYTVYIGLYLLLGLVLIMSAFKLKNFKNGRMKDHRFILFQLTIAVIVQILLPVSVLFLIPWRTGTPWTFILYYVPDLGYFILSSAVIEIGIGMVTVYLLVKAKMSALL